MTWYQQIFCIIGVLSVFSMSIVLIMSMFLWFERKSDERKVEKLRMTDHERRISSLERMSKKMGL